MISRILGPPWQKSKSRSTAMWQWGKSKPIRTYEPQKLAKPNLRQGEVEELVGPTKGG